MRKSDKVPKSYVFLFIVFFLDKCCKYFNYPQYHSLFYAFYSNEMGVPKILVHFIPIYLIIRNISKW